MKKLLLAVLAAFALTGVHAQAFPDIPANHWAGEAVQRIADLGIVIGFPDGTYRGNEGFTRYQAALVISRMLDVIKRDMDAEKALNDADIAALRNAMQELASDVAAQDVRLNAVEGAVASISDDTASNTARIEALEAAMGGAMGMDPAVMADLQNQLDALRVAADTAQSTADGAAALGAQNSAAIDAINDLLALLNQDVEDLKAGMGAEVDLSGIQGQVDRNASDIANIREFVILLRRDQVALRDRVAALEASDASQQAALDDLAARVTKIEEDLFLVTGSITLTYKAYRLSGDNVPFDSDRVWGLNNDRKLGAGTSRFSSGDGDDYDGDPGDPAQDRQDIEEADGGDDGFSADVTINLDWSTARNGTGDPRALNSFDSVIKLTTKKAANLCVESDCSDDDDPFSGYVFTVDSFTSTFDPIGAAPITFQFGEEPSASFTQYIFNSGGPGFVATVAAPDFLAFLNPTLVVAGGAGAEDTYMAIDDVDANITDDYYRGIRGTMSPLQGDAFSATGGFSFAQYAQVAGENADAAADNVTATVWGLDAQIGVSILDIEAEFASQSVDGDLVGGDSDDADATPDVVVAEGDATLFYVKANVDVASLGIPVLKSLQANYRMIPADWFGVLTETDDQPFAYDQTGFGVKATLNLFIVDITGYFDSYSTEAPEANVSAFGVDATAPLFAGFSLSGFFHSASVDGAAVNDLDGGVLAEDGAANDANVGDAGTDRDNNYDTGFGVKLAHAGDADNALIPNLNLSVEYKQTEADFSKSTLDVNADYTLKVSIVELTPYVGFKTVTDADTGSDDTSTIKAGTGLSTDALDIIFKPSLAAAVNFRTTSHSDADEFTATELQWGVGLTLNEFLLANSTLEARYGMWNGTNIRNDDINGGDGASDISDGDENNDTTQSVSGYEVHWDYFDLRFTYGGYTNDPNADVANDETAASAFRIAYTVNF
jgi:predicted  nucleic acid-binding Zn-ribbon protein